MTEVTPLPLAGTEANGGGRVAVNNSVDASRVNSFRIAAVADRLALHVGTAPKNDTAEFGNLCLSLARGIDFSISNQEVPSRAQDMPSLLKQVSNLYDCINVADADILPTFGVCQCKDDAVVLATIMVLMISVKSACQCGWFSERDSEELQKLANEIASNFCTVSDFNTEPTSSLPVISTIMARFYPTMKMGHIFAFLEVQPGYGTYVRDFQISKNVQFSREDRVRLFVVQVDSLETSSCLVNPPKGNFLLNGKGVDKRTNLFMDTGPQIPTLVTPMLKYGSNLLQALGDFNGKYIIAVALMSSVSTPDVNVIQDYVQPVPEAVDSDSEIIESRISINCPISFKRIKTPVKGQSCKHLQCFDYNNYVDINSRRPSWRCPHCHQHVCFTDIRLDQNMAKVLKEVGPNATEVIISADGSWSSVMETDDATKKADDKPPNVGNATSTEPESTGLADATMGILDLTEMDDGVDVIITHETEDRKLSPTARQNLSTTESPSVNPQMASTNNFNGNTRIEDQSWSGILMATLGTGTSNVTPNPPVAGASNRELEAFRGNAVPATSVPESNTVSPSNLQLQQYQFGNQNMSNEYGRHPSISSHVTRTPIAIQALPARTPTSGLQQRPRTTTNNTFMQNSPSTASQASPSAPLVSNSVNTLHSAQMLQMPSSSMHQYPGSVRLRNYSAPPVCQSQQNTGLQTPNQATNAYRTPNERQGSNSLQMANLAVTHAVNQSFGQVQSQVQPSGNFVGSQMQYGVGAQTGGNRPTGIMGGQQSRLMVPNQRSDQMARPIETSRAHPYSVNPDSHRTTSVSPRTENTGNTSLPATSAYDQADQNWRPTARMRGALSGQAYSDALNQYILRPTPQPQAARPISNAGLLPVNVSAPLQPPMARPLLPNYPSGGQASRPRVPGVPPEGSSGN